MACKSLLLMVYFVGGCLSAPIDDPIRIDLPVYDQPQVPDTDSRVTDQPQLGYDEPRVNDQPQTSHDQPHASSDIRVSQGILLENHPGGEADASAGGNFISYKIQQAGSFIGNTFDSKANFGPFAPNAKIESAVYESEGLGSRALSVKENLQSFVAGIFQPKPIVDTIAESEKFGNNGDKFYSAGQVLVKGASNVSNILNSIFEIPGVVLKSISRSATEKLNNVGAKLVGL